MSIISRLACSLGRRDEVPNRELAEKIAAANDSNAVKELVANLNNKDKNIQSDCIKVLDETGKLKPALVAGYVKELLALLDSKNNRLQWGAMAVLDSITTASPEAIAGALPKILDAAEKGSVITKDHTMGILIKLCAVKQYAAAAFELLIEQLRIGLTNQLPMYAERSLPVVTDKNKALFIRTLTARLKDMEKESGKKRVEKVIKKLSGK